MKKTKAFLNSVILAVVCITAITIIVVHGRNPLTVPVVRVSIVDDRCLSVIVVASDGKEMEKSCEFFTELKREKKPYVVRKVGPEQWTQKDRGNVG
ncbi:MAG: hypothetical protein HYT28_03905 [Parcubacteria group bacterium]|nr:hypothetical protein [Parcubacteria group bacterium]